MNCQSINHFGFEFLVPSKKDKRIYSGFVCYMLRKYSHMVKVCHESRHIEFLDWDTTAKLHDEWRQVVKKRSSSVNEKCNLNKAKEALKKALTFDKKAEAHSRVHLADGKTSRSFVIKDENTWKAITEQVRIEH